MEIDVAREKLRGCRQSKRVRLSPSPPLFSSPPSLLSLNFYDWLQSGTLSAGAREGWFRCRFCPTKFVDRVLIIVPRIIHHPTVGSELDQKIKAAAAEQEEAWKGAGETAGETRIWRIEQFQVKDWPKENYGKFFKGDSYIGEFVCIK